MFTEGAEGYGGLGVHESELQTDVHNLAVRIDPEQKSFMIGSFYHLPENEGADGERKTPTSELCCCTGRQEWKNILASVLI